MGNRRLSRKRLYQVEKLGQDIKSSMGAGSGMINAIKSASQHRQGQEIITEIAIDMGSSKGALSGGGGDTDVIGTTSKPSQICQLTEAVFGKVTEIRAVLVEIGANVADLDLELASGVLNREGSPGTVVLTGFDAVGVDKSKAYDDATVPADKYLYLCNGTGSSTAAQTSGKILIYIHGFAEPADL